MTIYHPEKAVTTLVDGKKFTTYVDAWTEELGEFACPRCGRDMGYHETQDQAAQGVLVTAFHLGCQSCHLGFGGIEDPYVFENREHFLLFAQEGLAAIKKGHNG